MQWVAIYILVAVGVEASVKSAKIFGGKEAKLKNCTSTSH